MRIPYPLILLGLVFGEIAGFIVVGKLIGVLPTLALVFAGMVAGVLLLRHHGLATLMRIKAEIDARRPPARPLAEGALLALASLLIMVPGFLTDIVGLLLLVPFVREALWRRLRGRVTVRAARAGAASFGGGVVDLERSEYGEAERLRPRPDSPWRLKP